jgi:hypothetical protein
MKMSEVEDHSGILEHFPDLVFLADADNEKFESVQVITLQQYYKDKAYEKVWDNIDSGYLKDLEEKIEHAAKEICLQEHKKAKEFVEIHKNHVTIGLNVKSITDEEVNLGLQYLASIEDFTPGERYEFGEEKIINYEFASKVSSLNN